MTHNRMPADIMNTPHESGAKHVTGEALFVDDIPCRERLLAGFVVYSPHAHARIVSCDLSRARQVPGVQAVLAYENIPGRNQMGPVVEDEPCLAEKEVSFVGQAVVLIAAETIAQCREAGRLVGITYEQLEAIPDIETALEKQALLGPERRMERGDADAALRAARHVIRGELRTGSQEHFYLETQVCLCVPGEGKEMTAYSSTQHPSETQALVAQVLGVRKNDVVVEVRRMGGAFGGKETQANHVACWTALLCRATGRPVKIRLPRSDDMIMTGKRHPYLTRYEAGFDDDGVLSAVKLEFNSDGGAATDLSFAIMERTMLHADNAYFIPNVSLTGRVWKTHHPPNTAMRGFGAPQAIAAIETIVDRVARALQIDSAEVRRRNFYGTGANDTTHYGEKVELNRLPSMYEQLVASSDYVKRREEVRAFNAAHEFFKKGIALTPVKFGISFTTSYLNQAGALVNIYTDGTVLVNHGGTEMGQGLNTKIRQIAAAELGVPLERVNLSPADTSKVPNTSATAASSGTDLNGMAVKNAIDTLRERIAASVSQIFSQQHPTEPTLPESIVFENDSIADRGHPGRAMSFRGAMKELNLRQVSLSATGFYRTPAIGWDKIKGEGKPFYYYAFGMAVSEVIVDVLTGEQSLLRTDILHDAGDSINPGIDLGQVEGGFIQGLGWCTTEEIKWDERGHLLTHSPDTYKIPTSDDIPADFRVRLLEQAANPETIRRSKAVGEPPFMLALSAWLAIKDAVSAVGNHGLEPEFSLPATGETILLSIDKLRCAMSTSRAGKVPAK